MNGHIDKILDLINRNELVFFVGAAVSFREPTNLPGFREVLNETIWALCQGLDAPLRSTYQPIHDQIRANPALDNIASWVTHVAPEYLFELCKWNVGALSADYSSSPLWLEPLNVFRQGDPNRNHFVLAQLLCSGKVHAVLTTNFDPLLEKAVSSLSDREIPVAWREEHFSSVQPSQPTIFKLHGSVNDPQSIAISLDEIGRRAASGRQVALKRFFEEYFVLVSGYRGADLDIFNHLVTTDCRGIFWNDLSEENVLPKVKSLLKQKNGVLIEDDVSKLFDNIADALNLDIPTTENTNFPQADFSETAIQWAEKIESIAKMLIVGDLWEYVGEWEYARLFFTSGHELCKRKSYSMDLRNIFLNRLANLAMRREKYSEVLGYCRIMIHNAASLSNLQKLYQDIHCSVLIAKVEALTVDLKQALGRLGQSLDLQAKLAMIDSTYHPLRADILYTGGALIAKARYSGHLYDAERAFAEAMQVYDEVGDVHGRAKVLMNFGITRFLQGKFQEGLTFCHEAEYLFGQTGDISSIASISLDLAREYYAQELMEPAAEYGKKAMYCFEILSDERRRKIAALIVKRASS